jgi:tRNA threonylcarbamoyladenosine biosynthesis protein TsaE
MKGSEVYHRHCIDEPALQLLASTLAELVTPPLLVTLRGELGAGKTTFVRAWLRQLGIMGHINSPTFTLVEPYETKQGMYYHFDLYRLKTPEELELLGFRDYLLGGCLIEWPENGQGYLPEPDIQVHITFAEPGRQVALTAGQAEGKRILMDLTKCPV